MKIEGKARELAADLLDFIDCGPSPWHVVETARERLMTHGFVELDESEDWLLEAGARYFVVRDGSSLIAFKTARKAFAENGFRIVGAHTDSPGLRIKPRPLIQSGKFDRLGVEVYGGPILATFADRDLSIAGRVTSIRSKGALDSRLLRIDHPILRLPNLAIHMNRQVNELGLKLDLQGELPLLLGCEERPDPNTQRFVGMLAEALGVEPEGITAWDLCVFDTQKASFYGLDQEFFAASRIDNLASCHAALCALLDDAALDGLATNVCALFDHEEIGSLSLKGANGSFLPDVLERIALAMDSKPGDYQRALRNSFLISADMAHAFQPNFQSFYEPEHLVFVNHGPVIKVNVNQRYSSESISQSRFVQLCMEAEAPWQQYSHRSNLACGSTIGPMTSARLGIRSVDVGCPMWAMHSIRESAGVLDHTYMTRVLRQFFSRNTSQ